ncbi:hypothetical protein EDB83DRAFT_2412915 [Lactarius deliciosus]|nr:hypothetical protein EDB83DRAFT_2412915 [Lactarius deliciosus]
MSPRNFGCHQGCLYVQSSLCEDWLWCETWCSEDGLDRAKTVALCQNPLTREPKLAQRAPDPRMGAIRCRDFTLHTEADARTNDSEGRIHACAAAADVNELTKAGAIPVPVPAEETTQSRVAGEEDSEDKREVPSGLVTRDAL